MNKLVFEVNNGRKLELVQRAQPVQHQSRRVGVDR